MKNLHGELLQNSITTKKVSKSLVSDDPREFIKAFILICTELDIDVQLWTSTEDKALKKRKEVSIKIDNDRVLTLKISD